MDVLHALWGLLTEPWALLMLAASFLYAGMNYLDEWLLSRLGGNAEAEEKSDAVGTLVIISGLFGLVIASVFGFVALLSPHHATQLNLGTKLTLQAMLVGLFEIAYLIPYLYATKRAGTLEAAPLFQSIPVISLVLGLLFFGEVPPVVHIIGSIVNVSGAVILNIVPGTLKLDGRTIGLMLLSSTIVALIYFLFKGAATEGNFIGTAFWSGIGMFLASVLIFVFWPPYRRQFMEFCKTGSRSSFWK